MTAVPSSDEATTTGSSLLPVVPALYASTVSHARRAPVQNRFHYDASYWLVDYDQMAGPRGLAGRCVKFRHADHCDIRGFLAEHDVVAERILMLAMARTIGFAFNPISVFWCYDASGTRVAVVAEVHNTYGGRHTYFLQPDEKGQTSVDKAMYVSPFYPVDGHYVIRVSEPGASISLSVTMFRENDPPFVAVLRGDRRPLGTFNVARASFLQSALRAALLIRWQGVRLWLRGLKVQPR